MSKLDEVIGMRPNPIGLGILTERETLDTGIDMHGKKMM